MPSFTIRFRVGHSYLDIDEIQAQTPHMACEVVSRLHKRFAAWISAVGLDGDDELTVVKGRCEKCQTWVLATDEYRKVPLECAGCAGAAAQRNRPELSAAGRGP